MKDSILRLLWRSIPTKGVSRFTGSLMKRPVSRRFIPFYIKHFDIDLTPVKKPLDEFTNLLDFFVRELKPEFRPIPLDPSLIVSPVDGVISQIGEIQDGLLIHAKGEDYSLESLLGGQKEYVQPFQGGKFVTIYLSPRDYHRVHMPVDGAISGYSYLPGKLYPVNDLGLRLFPKLFAENERLVTFIQSRIGTVALVKVGATNVGSIKVTYDQVETNPKAKRLSEHVHYTDKKLLKKGAEVGRFEFGSTVILLFEANQVEWTIPEKIGTKVQMGQPIAQVMK